MTTDEIKALAQEVMRAGFHFTPRDARHTDEGAALLEATLNKLYRHVGRRCTVRLDSLGLTVTMDAPE